ncbi:MAG: acetate kinase, partial [Paracoccaceae bacterium]|nr:acetate kinase [Paracoccaceae bacterium]
MDPKAAPRRLLVLNAGSSSIKFALFESALCKSMSGIAEGIGQVSKLTIESQVEEIPFIDHLAALTAVLKCLKERGFELEKLT